ncbi:molybdenum ABC transporter ATP-binding protein [Litoreibacter roseus]|uniref:Molybdenum import ATP-binding protein ModC n=1 Tax=Litoreibacter roseus TaxID=2601869 RepID=A0A6N6JGS5_9RHOB|nr:molybdenum ABC transporter ATP-binding protein [Litoreibacter roseus]GFE65324.1 molybdenum import ATP-binding protein ModC [Litoreibacter roseus]
MIKAEIKHRFPDFALDVSVEADDGLIALFGPSGSGKTSVINAIAGLLKPDHGRISIQDRVLVDTERGIYVPPHQRRIGYVFQDARLFPHLSVKENLLYGQRFVSDGRDLGPVVDLLDLGQLLERRPVKLSGGEAQRVAIGRALLCAPQLLLMDEPLSALDARRRDAILPYLDRLHSESDVPIFYVSHAMAEVARLADHLVLLRQGRVTRQGLASELLSDPAAVPDIGVREAGAMITTHVAQPDAGDGLSELSTALGTLLLPRLSMPKGAAVRVRVLATDVILARERPVGLSALNILPATVETVHEGEGPGVAVALASGSDRLLARVTRRSARALDLTPGASCYAIIKSVSVAPQSVSASSREDQ